ncbi:unnamed protein product [Calicophoron daubneyi]|uniref:A-kinase anchor protein 7-like phosphoesterase domain-containing protein n=1 Tax=Calicophoron daubneyi TaxID=300641 RepID=A0AAV2T4E3_CALDB
MGNMSSPPKKCIKLDLKAENQPTAINCENSPQTHHGSVGADGETLDLLQLYEAVHDEGFENDDQHDIGDTDGFEFMKLFDAVHEGSVDEICHKHLKNSGIESSFPFTSQLTVPKMFYRAVIRRSSGLLRKLEHEFSCRIQFSRKKSLVTVRSSTETSLLQACERLKSLQSHSRLHLRPTHFICLAANQPEMRTSFESFRDAVLEMAAKDANTDFDGVDASIFNKPTSLHFTFVTLALSKDEVQPTHDMLKDYFLTPEAKGIFAGGPLQLTVKGVECMNPDPRTVRVLYAKIASSPDRERLQRMANAIRNLICERNLAAGKIFNEGDDVLLHMTLMNSFYRIRSRKKEEIKIPKRKSFNALGVLREMNEYCFVKNHVFDSFHLCLMARDSEGYYRRCCDFILRDNEDVEAPVKINACT